MINILDYFNNISLIQIGAGGTGSWLVPLASKLVNNIYLRLENTKKIYYTLVDFDIVEERNILRQNFQSGTLEKIKLKLLLIDIAIISVN